MKTKVLALLLVFTSASFALSAKGFESPVRKLFDKYQDQKGIQMIYFGEKMLEIKLKGIMEEHPDKVSSDILDNFNELIMIGGEDEALIPDAEITTLRKDIRDLGYDQIIKMVEDDESLTVYMLEDDKNDRIKDLILMALEDDEQIILSISGNLRLEDIVLIARLLDINILEILDV